jgi:phosphoenolpyruvate-protein kinase (PTS system EI component)
MIRVIRAFAQRSGRYVPRSTLPVGIFPGLRGARAALADPKEAKARLREAAARAPHRHRIEVGAMIETPAAVFLIDEILDEVDFVSLGTSDLTQFVLAADRDAVDLVEDYSTLHPSVLRAIRRAVEAADGRGRPVSVCGEAAGDPATAALLVGLGARELSMSR